MRLSELIKEGKKLISELVSELDDVELAFYQHNPADIDQIIVRVIDEVVPKKADELLRLALDDNLRFALDTPKYVNRPEPNAVDLIEANVIEYVEPYFTQWVFEAMKNRGEKSESRKIQ